MSKYPRPVVASKYGNRPLIEVPAVTIQRKSYSASNAQQQALPVNYIQPGYAAQQPSLMNQPAYPTLQQQPYAPLYVSPAPSPQQQYMPPGQFPQQQYVSPAPLPQQQYVPPAPAPIPQQAPPLHRNWSNVANNSNFVPYVDSVQLPQTQPPYGGHAMPNLPGYNQQQYMPNAQQHGAAQNGITDAKGEVHHFYGPNGTPIDPANPDFSRVWGGNFQQLQQSNAPSDFVLEGKVEYGRLTSVKIKDSKFSFRDVPEVLINEIKRVYREVPKTKIKVIASRGEYNIYAMPHLDELRHESYVYEPHERYHASYKNHRSRPLTEVDPYTKLYSREDNVRLATERRNVISQGHYVDSDDEAQYPMSDTDARRRWRKLKNTIRVRRE